MYDVFPKHVAVVACIGRNIAFTIIKHVASQQAAVISDVCCTIEWAFDHQVYPCLSSLMDVAVNNVSIDWFKGKITSKSQTSWENLWFPVDFPLSQPI